MVQQVSHFLRGLSFDDFARRIRESVLSGQSPEEWVAAAAGEAAPTIYRAHYERFIPQSLMAFAGALGAGRLLDPAHRVLPVIQALWFASHEEKLSSYPLSGIPEPGAVPGPADLAARIGAGDFETVYAAARLALRNPGDFAAVREALIAAALRDTGYQGQKLIYLQKSLELVDALGPGPSQTVLFPAIHFLAGGRTDRQFFEILTLKLAQAGVETGAWLENRAPLSREEAGRLGRVLIYQYPALIIENLMYELNRGIAMEDLFEAVLWSAAEVLLGSYPEQGSAAAHGVHFACAARDCFGRTSVPQDKISLLFMAALFLNKMAVRSLNPHQSLKLEEVDLSGQEISPDALCRAIELSDPRLAGALALRLSGAEDAVRLVPAVVLSAAKNDGNVSGGHDLRLCAEMLGDFARAPASDLAAFRRAASLKALCYFLAQLDKDYDLYKACWIL
jgi:hypothetical protein